MPKRCRHSNNEPLPSLISLMFMFHDESVHFQLNLQYIPQI